ncbi:MAG: hypothetical protein M3353_09780 [Actinomycetota bacterium]|nr:hypothetical protein [Actinomycetota bacterium]
MTGRTSSTPAVRAAVAALLEGQRADGGFGGDTYRKWIGGFWRLVSLVDLEVPAETPGIRALFDHVLAWRELPRHRPVVAGLTRAHATAEGLTLEAGCHLGLAAEPCVSALAESLLAWQWPDGGWNCDPRPQAGHSSFHESWAAMWGLWSYAQATGDRAARASALRAAELLLDHRVCFSTRTGEPVHPSWTALHYPPYYHYDVLVGLSKLAAMGLATDPRAGAALDLLERRRLPDGSWRPRRLLVETTRPLVRHPGRGRRLGPR